MVSALRAFAHPLRLRLFELFAEKPRTAMQAAEILGEPPTRLYHHVNALHKAGLLRLRETRPIRGTTEKYFEAVRAEQKNVTAVLRSSASARQSARAAASAVLERVRQDVNAEMADSEPREPGPVMLRLLLSVSPGRAAAVRKRVLTFLEDLKKECGAPSSPAAADHGGSRERGADEERWALTVAFARAWPRRSEGGRE